MHFQAKLISTNEIYDVFWWNGLFEGQTPFKNITQNYIFSEDYFNLNSFLLDENLASSDYLQRYGIVVKKNQFVIRKIAEQIYYDVLDDVKYDEFLEKFEIIDNSVKSEVVLLSETSNIIDTLYLAARQCYYKGFVGDVDSTEIPKENKLKLIFKSIYNI